MKYLKVERVAEIELSSIHTLPSHCLSGLGKMLTLWASVSSSVKWGHLPHMGVRKNGWVLGSLLHALLAVTVCGGASDSKMRKLRSRKG